MDFDDWFANDDELRRMSVEADAARTARDDAERARGARASASAETAVAIDDVAHTPGGEFEAMERELEQIVDEERGSGFESDDDDDGGFDDLLIDYDDEDEDDDDDYDDAFVTDEDSFSSDSHDSIDETQEGEVQRTQEAFETVVPETQVLISQQANDDVVIIPDEDADEIPPGVNDAIEVRDASALPTEDLIRLLEERMRSGDARELEARLESVGFVRADRDVPRATPAQTEPIRRRGRGPDRRPRKRRRRVVEPGQRTLHEVGFGTGAENGAERAVDDDDGDIVVEGVSRHIPRLDRPPVPSTVDELYDVWERTAKDLVPRDASIYSNFRYAFGDESERGERYREKEMKDIGNLLLKYKADKKPGQHAMLKGREREGKTGALFSITLAALLLNIRVVILCAPLKVAPICDMVRKLRRAGFGRMYDTQHTLGPAQAKRNQIPSAQMGQIYVASLCTLGDLKKVKNWINCQKRDGHLTLTLMDECDELTQGKGHSTAEIEHRADPDTFAQYIPQEKRGEDYEDVPDVPSDRKARGKNFKAQIAKASQYFQQHVHPETQVIACSATLSGYVLNPIGVFRNDLPTSIFKVFPKDGYCGIERFKIPEGCELEYDGNLSLEAFSESNAVGKLLQRFYTRRNECDGQRLQPLPGSSATEIALRGMLFLSCTPKVNVHGGVHDLAKTVAQMVDSWGTGISSQTTLFICYVGSPRVLFAGSWQSMTSGYSFEDIYNETVSRVRKGKFSNVSLRKDEPFSKVCTHVILIGYNLTRRAMTAAFTPKDEPGVLCKIQYGIITAPKTTAVDTTSQRVNRPSHEFAQHVVPENYSVDVAMWPQTLEVCQRYREMEDKMVEEQRESPKIHAEFRQAIDVYQQGLDCHKVSKRGIPLADMSNTGRKERYRQQSAVNPDENEYLKAFKVWLENHEYQPGKKYAPDSVESYYRIIRRYFVNDADIEEIVELVRKWVERPPEGSRSEENERNPNTHHNELVSRKHFLSFWEDRSRV